MEDWVLLIGEMVGIVIGMVGSKDMNRRLIGVMVGMVIQIWGSKDTDMKMINNSIYMLNHEEYKDYENEFISYDNKHNYRVA
jgi:hypothetical protein